MSPQALLFAIISISVVTFLFSQLLEYLNIKSQRKELPDEIAAFYDREKYLSSLNYQREKTRLNLIADSFSFVLSLLMLGFGGFGVLDNFLRPYFHNEITLSLAFFGILAIASDFLTLPFQWHSTFVIENKFGFNRTTVRTFIADKVKGYMLGVVIGGALLSLFIYLIIVFGPDFWIIFGIAAALLVLLLNMFYTSIFLPLFNTLTPLPDGELKTAIHSFAARINFPLANIYVMDGSKRSKKANAFFSGIGKKKKIVLYDTLISNHTTQELVAVLAHEVGHYKKKHIILTYILSVVQIFLTLFVLSRMVFEPNLSVALGGSMQSIHLNLVAFGILYSPISGVTGLLMSLVSRKNEFEADEYARKTYDAKALADALKKLSVDSLSNLYPHPWYVFIHYSHPPLLERLAALRTESVRSEN